MTTEELATFRTEKMGDFIAAWFDRIKERAGYEAEIKDFDREIRDLAESAVMDMLTAGVPAEMRYAGQQQALAERNRCRLHDENSRTERLLAR